MSVSKVRELCGYQTKPRTCSNCTSFSSERKLARWMEEVNAESIAAGGTAVYSLERNGQEANLRCGKHGFAVKKTAVCDDWLGKGAQQ